mmetsp:Transcript_64127/g.180860  ORF Transcript_64127/g.180860 Transcript_64127/m.180860 type:complete len:222 (-) Transcript_64127:128-793(-)
MNILRPTRSGPEAAQDPGSDLVTKERLPEHRGGPPAPAPAVHTHLVDDVVEAALPAAIPAHQAQGGDASPDHVSMLVLLKRVLAQRIDQNEHGVEPEVARGSSSDVEVAAGAQQAAHDGAEECQEHPHEAGRADDAAGPQHSGADGDVLLVGRVVDRCDDRVLGVDAFGDCRWLLRRVRLLVLLDRRRHLLRARVLVIVVVRRRLRRVLVLGCGRRHQEAG